MNEDELAELLSKIVLEHLTYPTAKRGWEEDFQGLTVHKEKNFVEIQYTDSGVGEDYVVRAFRAKWPDRAIDVDTEGGCGSCGYGRTVSITISGNPPWENSEFGPAIP